MEFKDVGVVVEAAHSGDLPYDAGLHGCIGSSGLIDDLDRHAGVVGQTSAVVNLREATTAE